MNLVETWVTNITQHVIEQLKFKSYNLHKVTADFNCYGREKY